MRGHKLVDFVLENADWLFSGLAIFVITSVFGLITWAIGRRFEQSRNQSKIYVSIYPISLPYEANSASVPGTLKITYNGEEFKNIYIAKFLLQNTGRVIQKKIKFILMIPEKNEIIDEVFSGLNRIIDYFIEKKTIW